MKIQKNLDPKQTVGLHCVCELIVFDVESWLMTFVLHFSKIVWTTFIIDCGTSLSLVLSPFNGTFVGASPKSKLAPTVLGPWLTQ